MSYTSAFICQTVIQIPQNDVAPLFCIFAQVIKYYALEKHFVGRVMEERKLELGLLRKSFLLQVISEAFGMVTPYIVSISLE